MFRVDRRFTGQGLWDSAALPMTYQAAFGQARVLQGGRFADDARIVQASKPPPAGHVIDLRV